MEQLALFPDMASQPIKTKQTSQQLSLIPPTAYMKPSKPVPKVKPKELRCELKGKKGKIIRKFTEGIDGLTLVIYKVEFDDGTIQDVLENHLKLL